MGVRQSGSKVKDIEPGWRGSNPKCLVSTPDRLYFVATTIATGTEIFSTDGTTAGTGLFAELAVGTVDGEVGTLTAVGSRRLYGAAYHPNLGRETFWMDLVTKKVTWIDLAPKTGSLPRNRHEGHDRFAVESGRAWLVARQNIGNDFQLWAIENGATTTRIGYVKQTASLSGSDPILNGKMRMALQTQVPNTVNVLLLGSPLSPPVSLPSGHFLYLDLEQFFMLLGTTAGRQSTFDLPIPNHASLLGVRVVTQFWSLNATTFPTGTDLSNGLHLTLGR